MCDAGTREGGAIAGPAPAPPPGGSDVPEDQRTTVTRRVATAAPARARTT